MSSGMFFLALAVAGLAHGPGPANGFRLLGGFLAKAVGGGQRFYKEYCDVSGDGKSLTGFVSGPSIDRNQFLKALQQLEKGDCARLIRTFTCAMLFPEEAAILGPVMPCRSVCNDARKSCAAALKGTEQLMANFKGPCKLSKKGHSFRERINKTRSGLTCQNWDSQKPHRHWVTPETHPAADLVNNYCRNPDGEPKGPWCYTTSKKVRWEYCDVPMCSTSLMCHFLPEDGCFEFKQNATSGNIEMVIKGTPQPSKSVLWRRFYFFVKRIGSNLKSRFPFN